MAEIISREIFLEFFWKKVGSLDTKGYIITNGLGYFCFYTEKIEVTKETIIVGVENYQVVWFCGDSIIHQRNDS